MLIYFIHGVIMLLLVVVIAPLLSVYMIVVSFNVKPASHDMLHNHNTSVIIVNNARYSPSSIDSTTLNCFILLHIITVPFNKITYPVVDFQSAWSSAQSKSQYTSIILPPLTQSHTNL